MSRIQKKFNDVSHIQKRKVLCFFKKNFVSHFLPFLLKKSILWVIFKKINFLKSFLKNKIFESYLRGINSVSRNWKKSSILWVIFKNQTVQFIASYSKNKVLKSLRHIQEIRPFLWVVFKKKKFNSVSRFEKMFKFLWVVFFFKKVQFCMSNWKNFNSLSLEKRFNCLGHIAKKFNSLSWNWKKFNSLNHVKKFNSLSHMQKKVQFLWVITKKSSVLRVIFENKSWVLGVIRKKSIRWVIVKKINFWVILKNKIPSQFFWVNFWVVLKKEFNAHKSNYEKKGSILWVVVRRIQFFE